MLLFMRGPWAAFALLVAVASCESESTPAPEPQPEVDLEALGLGIELVRGEGRAARVAHDGPTRHHGFEP